MEKRIISFTRKGRDIINRINLGYENAGVPPAVDCTGAAVETFAKEGFEENAALIFVGAAGIAVRAVSPFVCDKLSDSPVVVIDDNGTFVIPILSGHAGGANKLAVSIAGILDAVPVITTATDVNDAFSADVFAAENRLTIRNRDGIKKVSARALEGKPVTISIKDYPPEEAADIIIADETDREYALLLSPKRYVLGIGLKKGKEPDKLEEFVSQVLADNEIDMNDVYAVCTIDIKEDEIALKRLCNRYRLPLITFTAGLLRRAPGDFTGSEFVKDTVGVDNVCERAAILGGGAKAGLVVKKTVHDGMTIAVAKRSLQAI